MQSRRQVRAMQDYQRRLSVKESRDELITNPATPRLPLANSERRWLGDGAVSGRLSRYYPGKLSPAGSNNEPR